MSRTVITWPLFTAFTLSQEVARGRAFRPRVTVTGFGETLARRDARRPAAAARARSPARERPPARGRRAARDGHGGGRGRRACGPAPEPAPSRGAPRRPADRPGVRRDARTP